jgi:DNA polymerase-3 subunit gamma/tau
MGYETLYRKYRPRRFSEVVGQEHVVRALRNALSSGRIAHAFLFCGQRGTGKTTMARLLAMALNCEKGVTDDPCGTCEACESIIKGTAMDVLEIDAASHTGVDAVREVIIDRVAFLPALLRYRVFIIDEVHMLSTSSFNALLKTLEEPPPRVVFVLATTDPHKVPATVRSRCLRFDFRPLPTRDIAERLAFVLEQEGWQGRYEPAALTLIARSARGALRDALTMLEQAMNFADDRLTVELVSTLLGVTDDEFLARLVDALHAGDLKTLWQLVADAVESGRDLHQLVHDLAAYLRELLQVRSGAPVDEFGERLTFLERQSSLFDERQLMRLVRGAWELERDLRLSSDPQLTLEIGLLNLSLLLREPAPSAVSAAPAMPLLAEPLATTATSPSASLPPTATNSPTLMTAVTNLTTNDDSVPATIIPSPEGVMTLDYIRHHWGIFLDNLKRESLVAYTFLLNAEPTELQGEQLVLTFQQAFSYDCVNERMHRETIERVLREVFQAPNLRIKPVLSAQVTQPAIGKPIQTATDNHQQVDTETFLNSLFDSP